VQISDILLLYIFILADYTEYPSGDGTPFWMTNFGFEFKFKRDGRWRGLNLED